jgi:hypothetical protein
MNVPTHHIEGQVSELRASFSHVDATPFPDGTVLISIHEVPLPPGWNQNEATLHFLVPVGYPMAKPDCFWADENLRLNSGAMPMNTNITPIPHINQRKLWFSWHIHHWNPISDDLVTYVRVIQNRLKERR